MLACQWSDMCYDFQFCRRELHVIDDSSCCTVVGVALYLKVVCLILSYISYSRADPCVKNMGGRVTDLYK